MNQKLALALDVANIIPWKWNLTTHTILCDLNKAAKMMELASLQDLQRPLSIPRTPRSANRPTYSIVKSSRVSTQLLDRRDPPKPRGHTVPQPRGRRSCS